MMDTKNSQGNATNLVSKVQTCLASLDLLSNTKIVVGLSGGPDSVALLSALKELANKQPLQLIVAHLNHEWRSTADADAEFCRNLAQSWQLPYFIEKASKLPNQPKFNGSREALGRELRRIFFTQIRQKTGANYVALGHHLDDQIETFLIRLIRGSSLSGLCGMQALSGAYLRPLLTVTKAQIYDYLKLHKLAYCTDQTNQSSEFLRNRLRQIVPLLETADPRFKPNFQRTLINLQQTNQFLNRLVQQTLEQVSVEQKLNLTNFKKLDPFLQKAVLLEWLYRRQVPFIPSADFVDEVLRFIENDKHQQHQIHKQWSLSKQQNLMVIKQ